MRYIVLLLLVLAACGAQEVAAPEPTVVTAGSSAEARVANQLQPLMDDAEARLNDFIVDTSLFNDPEIFEDQEYFAWEAETQSFLENYDAQVRELTGGSADTYLRDNKIALEEAGIAATDMIQQAGRIAELRNELQSTQDKIRQDNL